MTDVQIKDDVKVVTTIANSSSQVTDFLNKICTSLFSISSTKNQRIVSLIIEWRPTPDNNKIATLQLCHGKHCLIVQMCHLGSFPDPLKYFFADEAISFVGVGIDANLAKLEQYYGIVCKSGKELGPLVDRYFGNSWYRCYSSYGFVELASLVLDLSVVNPEIIRRSDWNAYYLSKEQVYYATRDAYVSFAIGDEVSSCLD